MRVVACLFVVGLILGLAAACQAGDVVGMPTADTVKPGNFEYNFIYVDLNQPPLAKAMGAPECMLVNECFFGVTDWLELDVDVFDPEGSMGDAELNAYVTAVKETNDHPSLIVGAYNMLGTDFLGNDEISPFLVSGYTFHKPKGKPSFKDPVLRAYLGWGSGQHRSNMFGGLKFLIHPKVGGAVLSYNRATAFIGVYRPYPWLELRAGSLGGDDWYSFGTYVTW